MNRDELVQATAPEALVDHLRRADAVVRPATHDQGGDHRAGDHSGVESIREATYRGHHIVIRTRYRIEVDGVPVDGHLGVTNDGQVHYHAIPNYSFASAIDLVQKVIDAFPDDFPPSPEQHTHGQEE